MVTKKKVELQEDVEQLATILTSGKYSVRALRAETGATAATIGKRIAELKAAGVKVRTAKVREGLRGPKSTVYTLGA